MPFRTAACTTLHLHCNISGWIRSDNAVRHLLYEEQHTLIHQHQCRVSVLDLAERLIFIYSPRAG